MMLPTELPPYPGSGAEEELKVCQEQILKIIWNIREDLKYCAEALSWSELCNISEANKFPQPNLRSDGWRCPAIYLLAAEADKSRFHFSLFSIKGVVGGSQFNYSFCEEVPFLLLKRIGDNCMADIIVSDGGSLNLV